MKKYLSILLAVMMVLSGTVFAAPSAVSTVETTSEAEAVVDVAYLAEETVEEATEVTTDLAAEQHVIGYSFDKLSEGTFSTVTLSADTADVYNIPSYFPADNTLKLSCTIAATVVAKEDDSTDLYLDADASSASSSHSRWTVIGTKELPNGTYRITVDMKAASEKKFNLNIMQDANNVISASSITLSTDFQTFEKTVKYEKGVTNTTEGKTTLFGFQAFQENGKIAWSADNINLYYTPDSYTVTFAGKGVVPAPVEVVQDGYLVPSEFAAGVPDSLGAFLGWSLTDGGEILTDPIQITEATTLYSVFEEKEYSVETTSQYGKLAYYVDFDVASGTAMKPNFGGGLDISNYTTLQAPAIAGMPAVVEMETYSANYLTDGDNLVVKGTNYPRFWFAAFEEDGTTQSSFPKGVYTVEWYGKSALVNKDANKVVVSGTDTSSTMWKSDNLGEAASATFTTDYSVYTGSFTYDGTQVLTARGNAVAHGGTKVTDMTAGLGRIGLYTPGSGYSTTPRYYKWVKIWYSPLTVNVTFDVNGKDVDGIDAQEVSSSFNPSDYVLDDCGTSRFAGWSLTSDGDLITDTTVLTEDTTLYAVWDDYFYAPEGEDLNAGKLLAHIHFNNVTASSNLNSQMYNYGTISDNWKAEGSYTYPEVIISTAENNAQIDKYPANIWLGGEKYDSFKYNENNNGTQKQKHADNEIILSGYKETAAKGFFPKLKIINNNFGEFADGVYTFTAEVYAPADDNIDYIKYSAYAKDAGIESPTVYKDLPMGEKVYIKASVLVHDGVAYDYETMTPNEQNLTNGKVIAVGFNFEARTKEAVNACPAIHADNFRIYFKPFDNAPKAYADSSIRIAAPTGIRFRASVSQLERNNEELKEYGFIVTRKALLDAASIESEDFTFDSNVVKVTGVNYDGTVDKLFEQKNNNFFFTAVVYNIPASNYGDVLVVRPYIKVGETVTYGDAIENSILNVANALVGTEFYEANSEVINKIIAGEEI